MSRSARWGFSLACWLGSAAALAAQQQPDTTRARRDTLRIPPRLTELIVEGRKPVATVGGSSAIQVRPELLSVPSAPSLEQIFRTLPMLHVRRSSRGEAELSTRGSDSRQVAVLLDGVPLTLAWDGRADFSVIPANGVHEIEFIRGLSSMLYGPNVLGGVVELSVGHTTQMPTRRTARITSGVDHVGGYGGTAAISAPFQAGGGQWLVRAGAEYGSSPGFPLPRGVAEPLPAENELRVNTDSRTLSGFAAARFQASNGAWLSFSSSTADTERGIAAELGITNARFWRYPNASRTLAVLSGGTGQRATPFGGTGDLEASVGVDVGRADITEYGSRAYTDSTGFENGKDRTLTFRLMGDHTLGSRADLRGAFTLADIKHREFLPAGEASYRQRLFSVGGETVFRLVEGSGGIESLRLSVGGAYDIGNTPESGGREPLGTLSEWGARVGVSMALGEGNTLVHAALSRRGRFPALRELYSGALNRFAPNPDLLPEKLLAAEAGITTRIGNAELQAVGFRHRMNDAVVRITLPDNRFMRVNRNRLDSYGIELMGSVLVGQASLGGDLVLQSAKVTDRAAAVINRPENVPNIFGTVHGRIPVGLGVSAAAEARFTGGQFCIDPETGADARLRGGVKLNGELSRPWRIRSDGLFSTLEARLTIQNGGNLALYDQCGLPEPGRLIGVQIRLF